MNTKDRLIATILLTVVTGCAAKTDVITFDLSKRAGAYVLAYTTNAQVRRMVEDRLVADLQADGGRGFASYQDLPDLSVANRTDLIAAANEKLALAVLVINEMTPGDQGPVDNPSRISPEHPDLQSFYDYSRTVERQADPTQVVFAEVNAFLIEGDSARLIWTGTTWSFRADGKGGGIPGMSRQIVNELGKIRDILNPPE